jgi:hypothetical protein
MKYQTGTKFSYKRRMGVQHEIGVMVEWFKNKVLTLPSSIQYITLIKDK